MLLPSAELPVVRSPGDSHAVITRAHIFHPETQINISGCFCRHLSGIGTRRHDVSRRATSKISVIDCQRADAVAVREMPYVDLLGVRCTFAVNVAHHNPVNAFASCERHHAAVRVDSYERAVGQFRFGQVLFPRLYR